MSVSTKEYAVAFFFYRESLQKKGALGAPRKAGTLPNSIADHYLHAVCAGYGMQNGGSGTSNQQWLCSQTALEV